MTTQKIILAILALGVVCGLGFIFIKSSVKKEIIEEPIEHPVNNIIGFEKEILLKQNDKITFSDGLNVVLKNISDSRCAEGVQCFWAGELGGTFALSGGKLTASKEIYLGTTTKTSENAEGYTFSLKNATENNLTIVVQYKKPAVSLGSCFIGGCSAQICSDQKDVISTCEYTEKYACYKTATCERQASGQCGWTPTPALTACLSKPSNATSIY